jgi:hypothetical protein
LEWDFFLVVVLCTQRSLLCTGSHLHHDIMLN